MFALTNAHRVTNVLHQQMNIPHALFCDLCVSVSHRRHTGAVRFTLVLAILFRRVYVHTVPNGRLHGLLSTERPQSATHSGCKHTRTWLQPTHALTDHPHIRVSIRRKSVWPPRKEYISFMWVGTDGERVRNREWSGGLERERERECFRCSDESKI